MKRENIWKIAIALLLLIVGILLYILFKSNSGNKIIVETDKLVLSENVDYQLKALTYPNKEVLSYKVKDESVATIDEFGNIKTLKEGVTKITVKSKKKTKVVTLEVSNEEIPITGIEIEKGEIDLKVGQEYLIKSNLYPENASTKTLLWESSNPKVAEVDNGYIKALQNGIAQIMVKFEEFDVQIIDSIIVRVGVKSKGSLSFEEDFIDIDINEEYQLKPKNTDDETITYSIENTNIATITEDGLITGKSKGSTIITAISSNGEASSIELNVGIPSELSFESDSITIAKGEKYQLKGIYDNTVEWYSNNIKVVTIDTGGIIKGISIGEATITAINSYGKLSTIKVIVNSEGILATDIFLSEENVTIQVGKTYPLTATVLPTNITDSELTWETSDSRIATIDSSGLITALKEGTAKITAYTSNNISSSINVTVSNISIVPDRLEISPSIITIVKGNDYQLMANLFPSNANYENITWESDNNNTVSVNDKGVVTAKKVGSAVITASTGNMSASALVSVSTDVIEVTSISITNGDQTLEVGQDTLLKATYLPENATNASFIWSSSNSGVASVSNSGLVTAKAIGTANITIKSTNGKKSSITITVKQSSDPSGQGGNNLGTIKPSSVYLSMENFEMRVGDARRIRATILPLNATNKSVTWFINNPSVVTVDNNGLVNAISPGTATLSVLTSNGLVAKTTITVVYEKVYREGPGDDEKRYRKTVTIDDRTYYVYYQSDFADVPFQSGNLAIYGCSAIAFTTAASGFKDITPWDAAKLVRSRTFDGIKGALDKVGISYSGPYFYNSNNRNEAEVAKLASQVRSHLDKGLPVIALVTGSLDGSNDYASSNHFITLLAERPDDGSLVIGNCVTEYGNLEDLIRYSLVGGRKGFLFVG